MGIWLNIHTKKSKTEILSAEYTWLKEFIQELEPYLTDWEESSENPAIRKATLIQSQKAKLLRHFNLRNIQNFQEDQVIKIIGSIAISDEDIIFLLH